MLVNERTLLPVLMPLAPAATLATRFMTELAIVLRLHGASPAQIARETAAMGEVCLAKTANRKVLGTMNEFAFLAQAYREDLKTLDLQALSMWLTDTPCGAIKYDSPARLIAAMGDGGPC